MLLFVFWTSFDVLLRVLTGVGLRNIFTSVFSCRNIRSVTRDFLLFFSLMEMVTNSWITKFILFFNNRFTNQLINQSIDINFMRQFFDITYFFILCLHYLSLFNFACYTILLYLYQGLVIFRAKSSFFCISYVPLYCMHYFWFVLFYVYFAWLIAQGFFFC